jgi:hypothetical protein
LTQTDKSFFQDSGVPVLGDKKNQKKKKKKKKKVFLSRFFGQNCGWKSFPSVSMADVSMATASVVWDLGARMMSMMTPMLLALERCAVGALARVIATATAMLLNRYAFSLYIVCMYVSTFSGFWCSCPRRQEEQEEGLALLYFDTHTHTHTHTQS